MTQKIAYLSIIVFKFDFLSMTLTWLVLYQAKQIIYGYNMALRCPLNNENFDSILWELKMLM